MIDEMTKYGLGVAEQISDIIAYEWICNVSTSTPKLVRE